MAIRSLLQREKIETDGNKKQTDEYICRIFLVCKTNLLRKLEKKINTRDVDPCST